MARLEQRRATYADLERLPDNMVGEILDGELVANPRPSVPHAATATFLAGILDQYFRRGGSGGPGGWGILFEPELHLGEHVVVPDIAGWRRERMPRPPTTAAIELPPDWVCEVLSGGTARHDRGSKMRIYAHAAVTHYWINDPIGQDPRDPRAPRRRMAHRRDLHRRRQGARRPLRHDRARSDRALAA